ncbi:MAG: hypothetical protein AVDCRST_MAG28-252 [uncultured Rubrobacteraceae bacterium]|uniref:Uncharacterized protein n=1 Tax=uncultured Rubrobacteraceae bacterium TaxID=349277 RepID=A0A6J4QCH6_9ACTN|nr:MAG: hypothetical protein AVDCRST_MAG28-252 [uncultured Rubrobacteraceae bacterium]
MVLATPRSDLIILKLTNVMQASVAGNSRRYFEFDGGPRFAFS